MITVKSNMQVLILFVLAGLLQGNYSIQKEYSCLNYKTKTYQVLTAGVDKSKVDSIIANSKVEPKGFRTYENGKLISAFYPRTNQFGSVEQQEQHIRNEKGDVLMNIMNLGGKIDTTFYTYNEIGKLSEIQKKITIFDKPVILTYKYSYSNDTTYEKHFWNEEYERSVAKWKQQEKPEIDIHQIIHPSKSSTINKFVWDENQNCTEYIQCENDSCFTTLKFEFIYDDCGRVLRKIASYDPVKNTIWSIEWNEIIE